MKTKHVLLCFVLFLMSNFLNAQCTSAPNLSEQYEYDITKCTDEYNFWMAIYADSIFFPEDSTSVFFNFYDSEDTELTNLLLSVEANPNYSWATFGEWGIRIPGANDGFIIEAFAENDCGTDSYIVTYLFEDYSWGTLRVFPDTSCSEYRPSYIEGPNEINACSDAVSFTLNSPNYEDYNNYSSINWRIETDQGFYAYRYTTSPTLTLTDIPNQDFRVKVLRLDSCTCSGFSYSYETLATKEVKISTGSNCGLISGQLYTDEVGNCFNEEGTIGKELIKINDNYVFTKHDGSYAYFFPYGEYDIEIASNENIDDCNSTPLSVSLSEANASVVQNLHASFDEEVADVSLYTGRARVGRDVFGGIYYNIKYSVSPTYKIILDCPEEVTMQSFTTPPSSENGNTFVWDDIPMTHRDESIWFTYQVNEPATLGQELDWKVTIEATNSHIDSTTNTVVNSYDPNLIEVNRESILKSNSNKQLKYTVHFQNTGNDTAFLVTVVDQLHENLDVTTLELAGSSHPFEFFIDDERNMTWTFPEINLLDSTSNEEKSKGWFQFYVDFNDDVEVDDKATSTAYIYFDTNEPIITNTAISTITTNIGILEQQQTISFDVYPNPANNLLNIKSNSLLSKYEIFAIDGRVVKQGTIKQTDSTLDISKLHHGIYYIRVKNSDGATMVKPFEKL